MIDRKFFFDYVRAQLFGKSLTQGQVDGMEAILAEWDRLHPARDPRWLAYILATAHHETDKTMQPIEEYGRGVGHPYGKPDPLTRQTYFGRGFVQITWKFNYEVMGKRLGIDLVTRPELALDLKIAVEILFTGMMDGTFTGVGLGNYFRANKEDWINARRIVNGLDKAALIAGYGKYYLVAVGN